jgi:ribonuclease Z
MLLTFLGTSAAAPTRTRNMSALALRLPERAEVWLFDCGEATQHQIMRSELKASQIRRIFITHLHGDHLFGLPGLLATRGQGGEVDRIDLYGPAGLDDYLQAVLRYSHTRLPYEVGVHTVCDGQVHDDGRFAVRCAPLEHRVPAFGYRVSEHDRAGAFDAAQAAALGIPAGPLYGRLKHGERITLPDGRQLEGRALVGPPERGRSLAYCSDTTYSRRSVELASAVDLLVHEATFAERDAELAQLSGHSTASGAARVAREAGVGRLVLTHFSARYATDDQIGFDALLAEARAIFPATELAADFLTVEIPRHQPTLQAAARPC